MHIPDGYLGPQTCIAAYAATSPFWIVASRKLNQSLRIRQVPLLALSAAFSFVIMMFNIPFLGTQGHAVGAVLVAILLGPWAACIAVSVALVMQALIFQDGGITSLGANCLNMAVIMPFVGYGVYRLIAGNSEPGSRRRWIGAAMGSYIGLNAAALSAGIMFGIQPLICHDAAGHSLYSPYPLRVVIPALMSVHLLFFGFVEAMVTGAVIAYLQRNDSTLLNADSRSENSTVRSAYRRLWVGLALLILLSPLGLLIPAKFGAGTAWGEWSQGEVQHMVGYVPKGMTKLSSLWKSPMPDYALKGQENAPIRTLSASYLLSALFGVAVITILVALIGKAYTRNGKSKSS